MNTQYEFSLDYDGVVESVNHNSKHDDETLQNWFNHLVSIDVLQLGERTEGIIEIIDKNMIVDYKVFNSPNDDDFDEFHKEIKVL